MKLALEGKKALIIGAGHGIGLELANMLLDERAEVCAVARRVESLSVFSEKNGHLLTFAADLVPEGEDFSLPASLKRTCSSRISSSIA
ncbi:SDR family NAD(P)-dependent oxidoreductase [Mailhella sp.]